MPPYIKVVSDPELRNPHDHHEVYVAPKPEFMSKKVNIDFDSIIFGRSECIFDHGIRVPPKFPQKFLNGNNSGFCKFSFAYDEIGYANDIQIISCTDDSLAKPTVKAAKTWRRMGRCIASSSLEERQFSTIWYELRDENGTSLPLPKGY